MPGYDPANRPQGHYEGDTLPQFVTQVAGIFLMRNRPPMEQAAGFGVLDGGLTAWKVYQVTADRRLAVAVGTRRGLAAGAGMAVLFVALPMALCGWLLSIFGYVAGAILVTANYVAVYFLIRLALHLLQHNMQARVTGIPSDADFLRHGYVRYGTGPLSWAQPRPGERITQQDIDDLRANVREQGGDPDAHIDVTEAPASLPPADETPYWM